MTPIQIRSLRGRLMLTQAELAAALGKSTRTVTAWEAGAAKPSGIVIYVLNAMVTLADGYSAAFALELQKRLRTTRQLFVGNDVCEIVCDWTLAQYFALRSDREGDNEAKGQA